MSQFVSRKFTIIIKKKSILSHLESSYARTVSNNIERLVITPCPKPQSNCENLQSQNSAIPVVQMSQSVSHKFRSVS